ncbi:cysteine desulfurase family protein [Elioraea sp.]|jgi:cysteine desulfurase|uniref:cysteine desulfurase family protein n=2 Tax=Elioraea sp. TaxID=2185103 RepID=UPI0021DC4E7B|nr:cysteine desulfurase family protein [Elioraea sp.]GIX08752.1 MAG: cysteine desulfurase [Elioraea sp.]
MIRLHLDANATEPLRPEARAAVLAALDVSGNPSSVHAAGRAARRLLEDARERLAGLAGLSPATVVFTSGGTEANATALAGLRAEGRRMLAGATEHDSVLRAAPEAERIPVDRDGVIDLGALEAALAGDARPAAVAVMLANNETGTLQPVAAVAALCRRFRARLHVDAVQAPGRLPLGDLGALGADTLALSAHKAGGPKGAGALLLASGWWPGPLIRGGGQERGMRAGTEPLPAIAGFAAAAAAAEAWRAAGGAARLAALRDAILAGLAERVPRAVPLALGAARLPNTLALALPGVPAATQVMALDLAGVEVSAGAACSSGKVAESHVLRAMGLGPLAGCAIRVSLPWDAPDDAPARFLAAYAAMAARLARTVEPAPA